MSTHLSSRAEPLADRTRIPWAELAGVRVGAVLWGGLALVDLARLLDVPASAELAALAVLVTAASVDRKSVV